MTPMRTSAVGVGRARRRRPGRRTPGAGRRRRRTRTSCPSPSGWSRRFVRSSQPRFSKPSRRSPNGSLGGVGVALAVVGEQVAHRVAQRRREVVVGAEDEDPRHVEQLAEARRGRPGTASWWARLSPVLTTRSGSRSASAADPGALAGLARASGAGRRRAAPAAARDPGGSTGTVARRSANQRTSTPAAYARARPRRRPPGRRAGPPCAARDGEGSAWPQVATAGHAGKVLVAGCDNDGGE